MGDWGMTDFLKKLFGGGVEGDVEDASGLCSYSGFVREAAVKALISRPQRGTLPILLVRLNDWVPQVRVAADAAVRSLMRSEFLPDWIASMDAVLVLQRARRADHTAMLNEIARFLGRGEHLPQVVEASKAAGPHGRRYVFDLTWYAEQDEDQRAKMLEQSLSGDDVVLAARALSRVEGLASPAVRRRLYEAACVSPCAPVRCEGVRWLVEHPDEATDLVVRRICLDVSSHVRWWCLHWLRSKGGAESEVAKAMEVAGDALSSVRKRGIAMQFLADADARMALAASEPWLTSTSARLRCDALSVRLAKGSQDEKSHWLKQAYADPSPKVRRLLLAKAHRGTWAPTVVELVESVQLERTADAVRAMLSIRPLYSSWDSLQCLLAVWPLGVQVGMGAALVGALRAWPAESNACSHGPDTAQSSLLAELWSVNRTQLDASLRQTVDFHLKTFGIE